jgi:hypothetical protein
MADDAEIGRLVREKKELDKKVTDRQHRLATQGSLLERIGRSLQQRPESIVFEHRSIPMEYAGRPGYSVEPLNVATIFPGEQLIEEVEALRIDMTALRQVSEKLRNLGFN